MQRKRKFSLSGEAQRGHVGQFFTNQHPDTNEVLPDGVIACILPHPKPYPPRVRNKDTPWKINSASIDSMNTNCKKHMLTWHGVTVEPKKKKKKKIPPIPLQQEVNKYLVTRTFQTVKRSLMFWVVSDYRPFFAVEGQGFLALMKYMGVGDKIPVSNTVKNEMMRERTDKLRLLKLFLRERITYHFIVFDGRKDPVHGYPNFAVILVGPCSQTGKTIEVTLEVIKMRSKTARIQADAIEQVYRNFADCLDRRKLLCGVGDRADKATIDNLKVDHVWCFGHSTAVDGKNSLIKAKLYAPKKEKDGPAEKPLINRASIIVRRVRHRYKMNLKFDELRKQEAFYVDGKPVNRLQEFSQTRLLGAVAMCDGVVSSRQVLAEMQRYAVAHEREDPWSKWVKFHARDFTRLEDICGMLRPLTDLMQVVGGQHYATLSQVFPLEYLFHIQLSQFACKTQSGMTLKSELETSTHQRIEALKVSPIVAGATLLHPFYRNFKYDVTEDDYSDMLQDLDDKQKAALKYLFAFAKQETLQLKDNRGEVGTYRLSKHWPHLFSHWVRARFSTWWEENVQKMLPGYTYPIKETKFFKQLKSFLAMDPSSFSGVSYFMDPLEWWRKQTNFPLVRFVAIHVLTCPASSFSVERLWSAVGRVLDKRRARLHYDTMEAQVFLHELYKFAERFGEGAESLLFDVDADLGAREPMYTDE